MVFPDANDADRLRREVDYYRRQVDELGGEILRLDYAVSGLRHELRQKRQAFAVLSELQQSVATHTDLESIFEQAIRSINGTLGMDKTVVLVPADRDNHYRPGQWRGFSEEIASRFGSLIFQFPREFAEGSGLLIANKGGPTTSLVDELRAAFDLPYFVCVPVAGESGPLGLLLTGRLREAKPLLPPFDQGDVDTFHAIGSLISSYVRNVRIGVLEAASRHKSEFLANMSHELRTPLNAVIGFSEVLQQGMVGELNDKQGEYIEYIHKSGSHLLSLINDILDLSKIEAGRMELELASFNVPMAIDNALTLVKERATRHGLTLECMLDEAVAEINADERKFKQVMLNLLSNAVKFTPEGGGITVAARPVDGAVEVSVTDTGVGIAPEDCEAVFEEFRQVGDNAERKAEGTGLGLALTRKFIELHGGRIWLTSTPGKGSTFSFTLPLKPMADAVARGASAN